MLSLIMKFIFLLICVKIVDWACGKIGDWIRSNDKRPVDTTLYPKEDLTMSPITKYDETNPR